MIGSLYGGQVRETVPATSWMSLNKDLDVMVYIRLEKAETPSWKIHSEPGLQWPRALSLAGP